MRLRRTFSVARRGLLPFALLALAGCAVNPVTGQRQFVLMSERQEIELGRDADGDIVESLGIYEDEALQAFVEDLGSRMAAASERPTLPWSFRVLDDPTVNAFALPGGYIYLTRGILAHLTSEAQVAGILGHEIGHVTARHGVTRMSRAQLTQVGLGAAMILAPDLRPFGEAAGAGLQLLFLRNSRNDERQADDVGFRYMRGEGYDPRELAHVFQMLARASGARDGDRIPGFLSTHPDPLERRDEVLGRVRASGEDLTGARVGREPWLRLLDGMVFGSNPREGFFRDGAFLHPEMAFRIDFPPGWRAANGRTQVQGTSPEQDAALVLSLAAGATPQAARTTFVARSGVETLRRWDEPLNGLPAAWVEFRVRADQQTFRGTVLFVRHGEHTFQVLGYAPQAAWDRRQSVVLSALGSFRELTDPEILAVEPRTIEIVAVPRAISFQDFLRDHPSTVPDETVAEINQLEVSDTIPAGSFVKRVVGGPPV